MFSASIINPEQRKFTKLTDLLSEPSTDDLPIPYDYEPQSSELPIPITGAKYWASLDTAEVAPDRRFTIIAMKDHTHKKEIQVGRCLTVNSATYSLAPCLSEPTPPLLLIPAVAGAAALIKDKSYTGAVSSLNAMFSQGSEPKMNESEVPVIRRLKNLAINTDRLFFRLAQLWWYTTLMTDDAHPPNYHGAVGLPQRVVNIAQVRSLWRTAKEGTNIVAVDLHDKVGQEVNLLSVLAHAVDIGQFRTTAKGKIPSILSLEVDMGMTHVAYTGEAEITSLNSRFAPEDVWDAAMTLEAQYGVPGKTARYLQDIAGLLYSPEDGLDPIYASPSVRVALAPLDTRGLALFPISVARNALVAAAECPMPSRSQLLAVGIVHSQCLSAGYKESAWQHGLLLARSTTMEQQQANAHLRRLLARGASAAPPIMLAAIAQVRAVLPGYHVGPLKATCEPVGLSRDPRQIKRSLQLSTAWEELVDIMPKVPAQALSAVLYPTRTMRILDVGHHYSLTSEVHGSPAAAAQLIADTGLTVRLWARNEENPHWAEHELEPTLNYRGAIDDHPYPRFELLDRIETMLVVKPESPIQAFNAHVYKQGQSKWEWWISAPTVPPTRSEIATRFDPLRPGGMAAYAKPFTSTAGSVPPPSGLRDGEADDSAQQAGSLSAALEEAAAKLADERDAESKADPSTVYPLADMKPNERENYRILKKYVAAGPMAQLIEYYRQICSTKARAKEIAAVDFYAPLVGAVAQQLQEVSLSTWLKQVPRPERPDVVARYAAAAQRVLPFTTRNVSLDVMAGHAARAKALETAMHVNSALTPDELQADGYSVDADQVEFLNNMAQASSDNGIPLSYFFSKPAKVTTRVFHKHDEEYMRNRLNYEYDEDQSGISKDERRVRFSTPEVKPRISPEDAYMAPFEYAAKVEERIGELSKKITSAQYTERYKRAGLEVPVDLLDEKNLEELEAAETKKANDELRQSLEGLTDDWDASSDEEGFTAEPTSGDALPSGSSTTPAPSGLQTEGRSQQEPTPEVGAPATSLTASGSSPDAPSVTAGSSTSTPAGSTATGGPPTTTSLPLGDA